MIESDFRSQLVRAFTNAYPKGVIWVNDVRYKAGWPDLYTVINGISTHYELKLWRKKSYPTIQECMTPLQIALCKRLSDAGARVYTLIYWPELNSVFIYNFRNGWIKQLAKYEFDIEWGKTGTF